MERVKVADRLLAILLLVIGIYSFHRVYVALGSGYDGTLAGGGMSRPWDDPASFAVVLAVFLAGGILCTLGAWWLWSGQSRGPSDGEPARPTQLFGRDAGRRPVNSSISRRLLLAFPLIAFAALAADHFAPWRMPSRDAGVESQPAGTETQPQSEPSKPQAGNEPAAVTSTEPVPEPAAAPSQPVEAVVPSPAGQDGSGGMVSRMPDPAGSEASGPQLVRTPELVSPPEVPAPGPTSPPEAVAPPRTTVPLPAPVEQPTQADGHRDAVVWLAVSPDGRSIVSASTDRTIKLWDIDGKRLIRDLGQHKDMARTALFLPDGARALTAGDDGEIVLRSLADGTVLHVFSATEHGGANKLALSRDGRRAVSVHEAGTVIVWDIENKTALHVLTGHDWSISGVAVSPDGTRAISGSIDGELKLWDIDKGRLLRSWLGHDRGTYGAVFTADGRQVLTGSGDYTIKLWDVETGEEIRRFNGHSGTVYVLALSEDGKRILSGSLDGTARLWDMATGNEIVQFGHPGPVYAVAFGADGTIVTGCIDRAIRVWPASGGEVSALFPGAP